MSFKVQILKKEDSIGLSYPQRVDFSSCLFYSLCVFVWKHWKNSLNVTSVAEAMS